MVEKKHNKDVGTTEIEIAEAIIHEKYVSPFIGTTFSRKNKTHPDFSNDIGLLKAKSPVIVSAMCNIIYNELLAAMQF